jgi:hypothetical protein
MNLLHVAERKHKLDSDDCYGQGNEHSGSQNVLIPD